MFEVIDPLKCPNCGGTIKIVSFIERHQSDVIEKILSYCGMWKEIPPHAPPDEVQFQNQPHSGLTVDYDIFAVLAG